MTYSLASTLNLPEHLSVCNNVMDRMMAWPGHSVEAFASSNLQAFCKAHKAGREGVKLDRLIVKYSGLMTRACRVMFECCLGIKAKGLVAFGSRVKYTRDFGDRVYHLTTSCPCLYQLIKPESGFKT